MGTCHHVGMLKVSVNPASDFGWRELYDPRTDTTVRFSAWQGAGQQVLFLDSPQTGTVALDRVGVTTLADPERLPFRHVTGEDTSWSFSVDDDGIRIVQRLSVRGCPTAHEMLVPERFVEQLSADLRRLLGRRPMHATSDEARRALLDVADRPALHEQLHGPRMR